MRRRLTPGFMLLWGGLFSSVAFGAQIDEAMQKAEAGDVKAQAEVCQAYSTGSGVGKDAKKAAEWCKRAAEAGSPAAQVELGDMYENGRGVPKDLKQALLWYQKAADQGYAEGQRPLGVMYELGIGVPKDPAKAADLYRKAADQGLPRAQVNLGILYETGVGVPKDNGQAVFWYQESVKKDYARGMNHLGMMYEKGLGVEKNPEKALDLFSAAAAGGYDKGKVSLDRLLKANPSLKKTGKAETPQLAPAPPVPSPPPVPAAPVMAKPETVTTPSPTVEEPSSKGRTAKEAKPQETPPTAPLGRELKDALSTAEPAVHPPQGEQRPVEAEKHFHLGNEYAKQGRYDLAITEYKTALDLDTKNSNTYENLAIAYAKKGELAEAINVMRTAIKLEPRDAFKRSTMGILHHANKDEARAMDEYVQAIRLNPTIGSVYNNMAAIFAQHQVYEKAWKCAKLAQALGHNEREVVEELRKAAPNVSVEWQPDPAGTMHLRQLVVEGQDKAEKLLAQLQKGDDFTTLVRTQGLPKYADNAGYLGQVKKGELDPAIAGEVGGLAPFAFSSVLSTPEGFRIFQRVMVFEDLFEPVDLPASPGKGVGAK